MEITEIRIKLVAQSQERLQAFCSITFESCFVVRDLKIIQGTKGSFVAMPSRKLTDRCSCCRTKNHLRALYCNQCGLKLDEERAAKGNDGRAKLYADIAHPIRPECREYVQRSVLAAYDEELIRAGEPNYICRYDDYGEEDFVPFDDHAELQPATVGGNETDSVQRRYEPGSNGSVQRPHLAESQQPERIAVSVAGNGQHVTMSDEDESFGAGLL